MGKNKDYYMALEAEQEGVSLNQLILYLIASGLKGNKARI